MAQNGFFDLVSEKMNFLTQRQEVIASNIANANVAGYKAKDIESFDSVLQRRMATSLPMQTGGLRTTNAHHMQPSSGGGSSAFKVSNLQDSYDVKPSGNAVDVEQQMTQMAQITTDYTMVTGLYKKMLGLLKLSIGARG